MSEPINTFEYLSRFIVDRNYFRANQTIKHQAFMPNSAGKTSVCRISGITDNQIWEIAIEVARMRVKPLFGRADIRVFNVLSKSLLVVPTDPPPIRHADIVGWPEDKPKRISIAQELAAETHLTPVPESQSNPSESSPRG
jgi:hypothetical protein